jgi:cytochrome P450
MSTDVTSAVDGIDLADGELYASGEPEAAWAELRRSRPVYWNERPKNQGFWAVTRYRDAVQVMRDSVTFKSAQGMRIDSNPAAVAMSANKLLIVADAPRHAKIRKVLGSAFTPRIVSRLKHNMRDIVRAEFAAIAPGELCEFTEFAAVLPVSVICDLLGVPKADWGFMLECTKVAFGESSSDPFERMKAHADIMEYYQDLVAERRRDPEEDLISVMANALVDDVPLTDEEIFLNCDGLISGGNETTRHATVGGLLALIQNPGQWEIAARSPETVDVAVNEILRWASPAMHVLRTPIADVEVGRQLIRANEPVSVWMPSANRDMAVFDQPDVFDVSRVPNNHLTLGVGPHYCLGASLARTELQVLFSELFSTFSSAEIAGPVRRLSSNLIWGYESAPVRLHTFKER